MLENYLCDYILRGRSQSRSDWLLFLSWAGVQHCPMLSAEAVFQMKQNFTQSCSACSLCLEETRMRRSSYPQFSLMFFLLSAFLMGGARRGEIALLHQSGSVSMALTGVAGGGPCCLGFTKLRDCFLYTCDSWQVSFKVNLCPLALKDVMCENIMAW